MNRYLSTLFLIVLFACVKNRNPQEYTASELQTLEKQGFILFQDTPDEAAIIFKQVAIGYEQLKNYKKAGITNLNISNIYDERLGQLDSALVYAQKSLQIWEDNKDSLQMANLYKYVGLLQGKSGVFDDAKVTIERAKQIYSQLDFKQGLAVSDFNLADMYFRAGDFESCESYFLSAKEFWIIEQDKRRVFTNNLLGIKLYDKIGEQSKLEILIDENRAIDKELEINILVKNEFHTLVGELDEH